MALIAAVFGIYAQVGFPCRPAFASRLLPDACPINPALCTPPAPAPAGPLRAQLRPGQHLATTRPLPAPAALGVHLPRPRCRRPFLPRVLGCASAAPCCFAAAALRRGAPLPLYHLACASPSPPPPFRPAVQSGDFVFGIASVFRVAMEDLLAVNPGMQTNTLLQVGGARAGKGPGAAHARLRRQPPRPAPNHTRPACASRFRPSPAPAATASWPRRPPLACSPAACTRWVLGAVGSLTQLAAQPAPQPSHPNCAYTAPQVKLGDSLASIALKFETTGEWEGTGP